MPFVDPIGEVMPLLQRPEHDGIIVTESRSQPMWQLAQFMSNDDSLKAQVTQKAPRPSRKLT